MLGEQPWRELVSGQRRGAWGAVARGGLALAELPYALAISWRNAKYDRGGDAVRHVGVPVISIGNLTVGGTGKTPLVCAVAGWFRRHGVRVAIVSRGYKADQSSGRNDEALELEQRLPDVPHIQNADRVAGAELAIEELGMQLILLDDGFQHRRIGRDLDIVVVDALNPFGYGHLLPRGMLREPLSSARRANLLVMSRADLVAESRRQEIRREFLRSAGEIPWVETAQSPIGWLAVGRPLAPLSQLNDQRVVAFCGIGNPDGFRQSLAGVGVAPVDWQNFPDHHAYSRDDIQQLGQLAQRQRAAALVCTHKDLVKINAQQISGVPVYALQIEVDVLSGHEMWESQLQTILRQVPVDA